MSFRRRLSHPTIGNAFGAAFGVPLGGAGLKMGTGSPTASGSDWKSVTSGLLQGKFDTSDPYGAIYQQRARQAAASNDAAQQQQVAQEWQRYQSIQDDPELVKEWQRRVAGGLPNLTDDEITTLRAQHAQTKLQGQLAGRVDTYFNDPNRAAQQEKTVDAGRTNALGDLAMQYDGAKTAESQDAGRRGVQGGSYDIENRGTIDRAKQATAADVEDQAQGQLRDQHLRDQQLHTQLLAHIYATNPGQSDAANANISSLLAGANGQDQLGAEAGNQIDISHFGNVLQSQAYGQTAKNLANVADSYAYNSSGGGW